MKLYHKHLIFLFLMGCFVSCMEKRHSAVYHISSNGTDTFCVRLMDWNVCGAFSPAYDSLITDSFVSHPHQYVHLQNPDTTAVDFISTLGATTITGETKSILFLGASNKLYHPSAENQRMKGFRAYFLLKGDAAEVRAFRLDFGDGETTGIKAIDNFTISQSDNCYDLSGRKIVKSSNGKMAKGVYIVNGKKKFIK